MASRSGSTYSDSMSPERASNEHESKRSIRYINTAAYIERNVDEDSEDFCNIDDAKSASYIEFPVDHSDIVPPLDLQSDDVNSTNSDSGYTYQKFYEILPLRADPDLAFRTWLSAKKKVQSEEAELRKRKELEKQENEKLRKHESNTRFKLWLQEKARKESEVKKKEQIKEQKSEKNLKPQVDPEEAEAKLNEWKRNKRLQDEKKRKEQLEIENRKREAERIRRENSERAWQEWLKKAPKKPKPVPLNRGLQTLRGTISDIYINPQQWQN